ncbi:hypothetical protein HK096_010919, partial [Nowakowskiella sp. JEL0078]
MGSSASKIASKQVQSKVIPVSIPKHVQSLELEQNTKHLQNLNSLPFEIHSSTNPLHAPNPQNDYLDILKNRQIVATQSEYSRIYEFSNQRSQERPSKKLSTSERSDPDGWTIETLSEKFGLPPNKIASLLRFWNTHELASIKGGSGEIVPG